ncbi:hypothetical protein FH972_025826 [Carpinus fangiana]|uniref:Uncharacterized protein n=1 Tax=Carpinus fangiana TaxID=176857 RepID=A0A5N6L249_9ROSI|nr:hypothetical protein FH972_025826 [Carpinus fangiana]
MGRRKIEIKAIKDDRNRSVYASTAPPLSFAAPPSLTPRAPPEHFSSAKAACSKRRMNSLCSARLTSRSSSLARTRNFTSSPQGIFIRRSSATAISAQPAILPTATNGNASRNASHGHAAHGYTTLTTSVSAAAATPPSVSANVPARTRKAAVHAAKLSAAESDATNAHADSAAATTAVSKPTHA